MKGVALLSSGIDSPVAIHLLVKQDFEVKAVHIDSRPHTDDAGVEKARKLAAKLGVTVYVIHNAHFHEAVRDRCNPKLHCILCKRFMYRVAEAIVGKEGADFIITGESLGQVASQTLENLKVIEEAVDTAVVRPLIGFDKVDTIKVAREIGTYAISTVKSCACPFVPKRPSTNAKIGEVLKEEGKIDVDALVGEALADAQEIK
jgi:thiamine biosynthesis protein ThiI